MGAKICLTCLQVVVDEQEGRPPAKEVGGKEQGKGKAGDQESPSPGSTNRRQSPKQTGKGTPSPGQTPKRDSPAKSLPPRPESPGPAATSPGVAGTKRAAAEAGGGSRSPRKSSRLEEKATTPTRQSPRKVIVSTPQVQYI